jgi:tight adherence protein B
MDGTTLMLLIAASVALLVFAASQMFATMMSPERRKLQERLAATTPIASTFVQRPITVKAEEVTGVAGALLALPGMQKLNRKLLQAWPERSLPKFLGIALALASLVFFVATGVFDSLFVGSIGGAMAGFIPFLVLSQKRSRRQRMLAEQLPEALDFLSRILRAGHSLSTGLQMMGEELPQPLASEFQRAYDQHTLGQTVEEGLKDMSRRIESTDFAFFVTAVLIQRQTGGDLSEVLRNISTMIRQRIRLQQSVKAKTAEGRFTGYILTAFPALMFVISYVLNPQYASVLLNDSTGVTLLCGAAGLTAIGLWAIRLITTVKV